MVLCALLATCVFARPTAPYPIPPQPLRLLVRDSEFILTASSRERDARNRAKDLRRVSEAWGAYEVVVLPRLLAWLVDRLRGDCGEIETERFGNASALVHRIVRRDGRVGAAA